MFEDLANRTTIFVLKHLQYRTVRHRIGIGAQFGQLVAERLGQDFGSHG